MSDEWINGAEMGKRKLKQFSKSVTLDGSIQRDQHPDWLYATNEPLYERHDYYDLVFAGDTIEPDVIVNLSGEQKAIEIDKLERIPRSDNFVTDASSWSGRIRGYASLTKNIGRLEQPKEYANGFDAKGMTERAFLILGDGQFGMCKRDCARYDHLSGEWTVEAIGDLRVRLERVLYEAATSPYATYERDTVPMKMILKVLSGWPSEQVGARLFGISKTHFWIRPLDYEADLFFRYVLE